MSGNIMSGKLAINVRRYYLAGVSDVLTVLSLLTHTRVELLPPDVIQHLMQFLGTNSDPWYPLGENKKNRVNVQKDYRGVIH